MQPHFKFGVLFSLTFFATSFLWAQEEEIDIVSESSGIRQSELFVVRDIPRTVDFDYDIGEIAIGNPSIASVVVDRPKRRMVISPLSVGETAILVFDSRGVQRDKIDIVVTSTGYKSLV